MREPRKGRLLIAVNHGTAIEGDRPPLRLLGGNAGTGREREKESSRYEVL